MGFRCLFALTGIALLGTAVSCRTVGPTEDRDAFSPHVGFIWHYPFVDVGSDRIAESGADVLMARCAWGTVQPADGSFDFTSIRQQLRVARDQGVELVLLLEFNPFCSPAWLRAKCRVAGETVHAADGTVGDTPRTGSAVFLEAQEGLLRELVAFLEREDPQGTVTHYMPGIEWWFPFEWRYAPADTARFRAWLLQRHGSLAGLNHAWDTAYTDPGQIQVPVLAFDSHLWEQGRTGLAGVTLGFAPAQEREPGLPLAVVHDWTRFWHGTAAAYVDSLATLVKRFDRSRPCASFGSLVWAQAAEWDYTDWSQMGADWVAHAAVDQDILGFQLPFHHRDTYRQTFGLDMARKYGRPLWDMDLTDFALGDDAGLRAHLRATHAAIQHGATGLFYCNWNGDPDFDLYPNWSTDDIAELVRQGRRALELTQGFRPVVKGAILNPITAAVLPGDPAYGRNNVLSFMGWYKLLERLPVTVDVVTLAELEQDWVSLDRYEWLLVPDAAFVSDRALDAMLEFAATDGLLLRGGRFAGYDENGVPRAAFGPPGVDLGDCGTEYAGREPMPRRSFVNPPPVTVWRPETEVTEQARARAARLLADVFRRAGFAEDLAVDNLGLDVRATILERGRARLVYLVNQEESAATGVRLTLNRQGLVPVRVYLDLKATSIGNLLDSSGDALVLPPFQDSALVELENHGLRR
jgi:hypothetical protein